MRHRLLEKDAEPVSRTGPSADAEGGPAGTPPPAGRGVELAVRRYLPRSSRSRSI